MSLRIRHERARGGRERPRGPGGAATCASAATLSRGRCARKIPLGRVQSTAVQRAAAMVRRTSPLRDGGIARSACQRRSCQPPFATLACAGCGRAWSAPTPAAPSAPTLNRTPPALPSGTGRRAGRECARSRARGGEEEREGGGQRDRRCAQRTTCWRAGVPPRAVWRPAAPHRCCCRGVKKAGSRLHSFACLLTSETAPPFAEKPAAAFRCGGLEGCGRAAAARWRAAPLDVPARRSPRVCPRAFVHACARARGRGGGGPGVRSYMDVCVLLVGAPTSSSSLPPCTRPRRRRGPSRTARA